ncbi:MAG: HDIG domain-containing metalloprotein [Candidatus Odinarchaeota archaeon]
MVIKEEVLPDREFVLNLLKKLKIPLSIRRHSEKVADKAMQIASKIKKVKVDTHLIEIGALLHDIGRTKAHGFNHALIGGKIVRQRGFSERLARICETHILGGIDKEDAEKIGLPIKDYLPTTLEEKIICLADKHMAGTKEVTIQERFDRWFYKYGKSEILIKSKKRIEKIQKEIEGLM